MRVVLRLSASILGVATAGVLLWPTVDSTPNTHAFHAHAPRLADVPRASWNPIDDLRTAGRLTPSARVTTYGGVLRPHPLLAEAALILSEELAPYAAGVYVTSFARAPEDQRRLMKASRYRYWTIQRSKHLLGYAADIGFYKRRKTMTRMHGLAEKILLERLGEENFQRLRVVRESRCLHVELNTMTSREEIEERTNALLALGILEERPSGHPIPALGDYITEENWLRRPRDVLRAVAY